MVDIVAGNDFELVKSNLPPRSSRIATTNDDDVEGVRDVEKMIIEIKSDSNRLARARYRHPQNAMR